VAAAGRRYQRTFAGAVKHGKRNATYQVRKTKVTHQGSLSGVPCAILYLESGEGAESPTNSKPEFDENGRIRCSGCAVFCGPFARTDFVRFRGGKNERIKGNRIRDSSIVIR
jgi:hypothetical protein